MLPKMNMAIKITNQDTSNIVMLKDVTLIDQCQRFIKEQ